MSYESLEEALQTVGSPVELLRNSQIGPYAFPGVRAEFTNWRDEQRAWRETCALLDQSHHMTDLYVEGPEALKLFSDLGVNSFKTFKVNQAKQFVACNHDGYVIGDAILFYLDENRFNLVCRLLLEKKKKIFDVIPPAELDSSYRGKRVLVNDNIRKNDGKPAIDVVGPAAL